MTTVTANELTGAALDWAVAKCEGHDMEYFQVVDAYQPSTDWAQGGPIIERELVTVGPNPFGRGFAANKKDIDMYGPTPLIAAMRCYVASKLGNEIAIPDELL